MHVIGLAPNIWYLTPTPSLACGELHHPWVLSRKYLFCNMSRQSLCTKTQHYYLIKYSFLWDNNYNPGQIIVGGIGDTPPPAPPRSYSVRQSGNRKSGSSFGSGDPSPTSTPQVLR